MKETKVGSHPHELAFSPDGRYAYVTDNGVLWMTETGPGENTVSVVDTKTQTKVAVIDLGKYRRPHGIGVDRATGNIFVTTELPSALLVIDPSAREVVNTYDVRGEAPRMVLHGPGANRAYVSNTNTGAVAIVDLATAQVKSIPVRKDWLYLRMQSVSTSPTLAGVQSARSIRDLKESSKKFRPAKARCASLSRQTEDRHLSHANGRILP